eukprot:7515123-Pyramimonas_sp.AAC.1
MRTVRRVGMGRDGAHRGFQCRRDDRIVVPVAIACSCSWAQHSHSDEGWPPGVQELRGLDVPVAAHHEGVDLKRAPLVEAGEHLA